MRMRWSVSVSVFFTAVMFAGCGGATPGKSLAASERSMGGERFDDGFVVISAADRQSPSASPAAALAQCLTDKGVKLYSTWWCGYCDQQKKLFGDGASLLPMVECATPGGDKLPQCTAAGITAYPTWVFPGGKRREGVTSLEDLASLSGCRYEPKK